jgi:WD40 repeat protein/serine/threonine protein kinase
MTMLEDLATSAPSEAQPGRTEGVTSIGPPGYELLDEVGRGGMGVVYRARDLALGRDVAVKLLADRYPLNSPAAERFVNEARITGQLQHPGIPAVHQVGRLPDGRPFLAMKLIKGCTLETILKDRPDVSAERGRLLAVFDAVCQAVGYAHAHRVIHRDLKPANVMVGAFGEVQVMDWGLAKVLGEEGTDAVADGPTPEVTRAWTQVSPTPEAGSHTQAGSLVGTPAYIPPEQAAGELAKVDERADVFGLGAVLTVILTGQPPYVGETVESVRVRAVRGELDDCFARLDGSGAEPELVALCKQCLAFEPADRPRDAGAVAEAVARLRSAAEERARTAERETAAADARSAEQRRKRRWQLAAAGAVMAALVCGLVGLGAYLRTQARANADLEAKNSDLAAANVREKQAKDELETTLYLNRIDLANRELLENKLDQAEELLDQCPADRRGWEWDYLKRMCRVEPLTVQGQLGGWLQKAAFSPDGQRLASVSDDKRVKVWDATTGRELFTLPGTEGVLCTAFRPDDEHRLVTGDASGAVTEWDMTTRQAVRTIGRHAAAVGALAFSPDGRRLASACADTTVKVYDATTGQLLHLLDCRGRPALTVAFSPDGRQLASGHVNGTVMIWDVLPGKELHTLHGHSNPVPAVAFSPDGRRLASAGFDQTVKIWEVATGRETLTLRGHILLVNGVVFLDGGRRVASVGGDKTLKIWDATTGDVVLSLRGHSQGVTGLASSPDGRRLASVSQDRTLRIWDATPAGAQAGSNVQTLRGHTEAIWALAFSSDGHHLASAGWDATVRVWDTTGGEVFTFRKHVRTIFSVAFSPDGRRIASGSAREAEGEPVELKVWDANNGREVLQPVANGREAFCVAYSPGDGRWIAAGNDSQVTVWDATTGQVVHTFEEHGARVFGLTGQIFGLAFSPDGHRLATLKITGMVSIYDATGWPETFSPEPRITFRANKTVRQYSLAFSPKGDRLVLPGDKNTIQIWDVTADKPPSTPLLTLRGHTDQVWGVAVSRDGQWVASGGEDNMVRLWDAQTGELIHSFRGHSSIVSRVAFSPDGKRLASASFDKTVKVWDLTPLNVKLKE